MPEQQDVASHAVRPWPWPIWGRLHILITSAAQGCIYYPWRKSNECRSLAQMEVFNHFVYSSQNLGLDVVGSHRYILKMSFVIFPPVVDSSQAENSSIGQDWRG